MGGQGQNVRACTKERKKSRSKGLHAAVPLRCTGCVGAALWLPPARGKHATKLGSTRQPGPVRKARLKTVKTASWSFTQCFGCEGRPAKGGPAGRGCCGAVDMLSPLALHAASGEQQLPASGGPSRRGWRVNKRLLRARGRRLLLRLLRLLLQGRWRLQHNRLQPARRPHHCRQRQLRCCGRPTRRAPPLHTGSPPRQRRPQRQPRGGPAPCYRQRPSHRRCVHQGLCVRRPAVRLDKAAGAAAAVASQGAGSAGAGVKGLPCRGGGKGVCPQHQALHGAQEGQGGPCLLSQLFAERGLAGRRCARPGVPAAVCPAGTPLKGPHGVQKLPARTSAAGTLLLRSRTLSTARRSLTGHTTTAAGAQGSGAPRSAEGGSQGDGVRSGTRQARVCMLAHHGTTAEPRCSPAGFQLGPGAGRAHLPTPPAAR